VFSLDFPWVSSRLLFCFLKIVLFGIFLGFLLATLKVPLVFSLDPPFSFLGRHWFLLVALTFVLYYFIPYVLCLCCMGFGFKGGMVEDERH
jgi:hypothetical protein